MRIQLHLERRAWSDRYDIATTWNRLADVPVVGLLAVFSSSVDLALHLEGIGLPDPGTFTPILEVSTEPLSGPRGSSKTSLRELAGEGTRACAWLARKLGLRRSVLEPVWVRWVHRQTADPIYAEWKRAKARREAEAARREEWKAAEEVRRKKRLDDAEKRRLQALQTRDGLLGLTPSDFERAVAEALALDGWQVEMTPQTADGGKDLVLRKRGRLVLVECKRYKATRKVGRPALQKLFAAMTELDADGGLFVATCGFSQPAREYASRFGIKLLDLDASVRLMRRLMKGAASELLKGLIREGTTAPSRVPLCPKCRNGMVLRKGPHGRFWGCVRYPRCRGTRQI